MHYKCGILSSPSACRLPLFFLLLRLEGPVASFETWLELGSQLLDHSGWCPASTWAVEGPCFLKSSVVIALKTRHKPACRVPKSQKNKSNPKQDGFVAGMLGSRTLAGHVADACPSSASFSWQLFAELYFTIYYFHHNPRWKKHVRGAWTPIALSLGAICGTSNLQYQKWSKRNQWHFTSLGLEEVQDSQDRSLWDTESFALEIKIKHVPQKGCPSSKAGKKLWQDCNLWNELFNCFVVVKEQASNIQSLSYPNLRFFFGFVTFPSTCLWWHLSANKLKFLFHTTWLFNLQWIPPVLPVPNTNLLLSVSSALRKPLQEMLQVFRICPCNAVKAHCSNLWYWLCLKLLLKYFAVTCFVTVKADMTLWQKWISGPLHQGDQKIEPAAFLHTSKEATCWDLYKTKPRNSTFHTPRTTASESLFHFQEVALSCSFWIGDR